MRVNGRLRPSLPMLLVFALLFWLAPVAAHPPGLSSVDVIQHPGNIELSATFAVQDIEAFVPMDADLDAEVSPDELDAAKPGIAALMAQRLRLAVDGVEAAPDGLGETRFDDNNVHVTLHFSVAAGRDVSLQSGFPDLLPPGHQQFVRVTDETGRTLVERLLNQDNSQLSWHVGEAAENTQMASTFTDFFMLGVEHIVTGYDHLLFLLGLLLVTHSVWPAIKIITFFTIAHSITLALAGLNVIDVPPSIVEPLIAVTIVYVAVENLLRGEHPKGRHWLTFGFGLIHGFGFASVLREMHIDSGDFGILVPLLSFNLGIEVGQIAIAALVLPLIWQLNNRADIAAKLLPICSAIIGLAGFYWLLERTVL
ncbi:MAG: HupE/UreJ family protein [Methylomonas sp.]|nr:HupE/UreJ family protein [Methylomonas sp.]PPD22215.1 MAG: hypothetical protein CTY23_02615 [Methylomonas sp.]PPD27784.1 MAG: hypothetical protein CTY22_00905 [Methylomonas sp.]PPD39794.1 MAG: hypothetical protein CTY21_00900 [Methylomonas sp.]PPD42608.1 MAG: hypothetical protein CTY17_00795 [Methylomonas sp.]